MRVFSETPVTIVALIVLTSLLTLSIYWLIHRGKINERNAKIGERDKEIAGLKGEINFLERQKTDLESKVKEPAEQKQDEIKSTTIIINNHYHYPS